MIRWSTALLGWAILVWSTAPAAAQFRINASPREATSSDLPAGISQLDKASFVYRPAIAAAAKPGVMVLFHGAGGNGRRFLELFIAEADRRNLILVSMQSFGRTWDIMSNEEIMAAGRARPAQADGRDAKRADAALAALFGRTAVDSDRIVILGFSDGASYGLSLGLANAQLFRGIVALAPGFIRYSKPRQPLRIAITHGTKDQVLPFANAERMADELKARGQAVTFLPFEGGHGFEDATFAKALDFTLGPGGK